MASPPSLLLFGLVDGASIAIATAVMTSLLPLKDKILTNHADVQVMLVQVPVDLEQMQDSSSFCVAVIVLALHGSRARVQPKSVSHCPKKQSDERKGTADRASRLPLRFPSRQVNRPPRVLDHASGGNQVAN